MAKAVKKKDKNIGKDDKRHRRADVLHVSKEAKIMAAYHGIRGGSFRNAIMIFGEAEATYKKDGRLILK